LTGEYFVLPANGEDLNSSFMLCLAAMETASSSSSLGDNVGEGDDGWWLQLWEDKE